MSSIVKMRTLYFSEVGFSADGKYLFWAAQSDDWGFPNLLRVYAAPHWCEVLLVEDRPIPVFATHPTEPVIAVVGADRIGIDLMMIDT